MVFLDALMEGLETFRVKQLIQLFPELFREYFVPRAVISAEDVISMLHPEVGVYMNPEQQRVWSPPLNRRSHKVVTLAYVYYYNYIIGLKKIPDLFYWLLCHWR